MDLPGNRATSELDQVQQGGGALDIHKPKPWHGLRDFLKEYGIIVLGVLTALGFEQAVESLHWRHEVEIERDTLRSEVRDNLSAASFRQSEQACVDARLNQIAEVFRRHARGKPLGLQGPVARPLFLDSFHGKLGYRPRGPGARPHAPEGEARFQQRIRYLQGVRKTAECRGRRLAQAGAAGSPRPA